MKLQHPHYANQKLATQWGDMLVDAQGAVEVKDKAAIDFFQGTLKFKAVEPVAKKERPTRVEPVEPVEPVVPHPEVAEVKKASRFKRGEV